jgi:hypothetical protein
MSNKTFYEKIIICFFTFLAIRMQAIESSQLPELLSGKGLYGVVVKNDQTIFKNFCQGATKK